MKFKTFIRNRGKFKDFIINSIAGLFTGVGIGIFFTLTTDIKFNRWINPNSIEIFPALMYTLFAFLILSIFYGIGMLITSFIDKKKLMSFHLNFISGTYCSIISFLVVLYYNVPLIRNLVMIIGILLFIVISYFSIQKKYPKLNRKNV